MIPWKPVCLALAVAVVLGTPASAAQKERQPRRSHCLEVVDQLGVPLPGTVVSWANADGETTKARLMTDGTCEVWELGGKLRLQLVLEDLEPVHRTFDLSEVEPGPLKLMVDTASGATKLVRPGDPKAPLRAPTGKKGTSSALIFPTPPANDDCANATPISGEGLFDYDTIFATTDGPDHPGCFEFDGEIKKDVWFCWTAPCTGTALVSNCLLSLGDSRIAVYEGCVCPNGNPIAPIADPIACGDDECGLLDVMSLVTFDTVAGQQYLIRVGNFPAPVLLPPTVGALGIACIPALPNDDCENAIAIPLGVHEYGSTLGASPDDVPYCHVGSGGAGVWYEVTGTGKLMSATTCSLDTNFDTKLSVYCRDCGPDMVCVAGNDDFCFGGSLVAWCSQAGATYRILVSAHDGQGGDFSLRVDDLHVPCIPEVRCRFEGAYCDGETCSVVHEDEAVWGGTFHGDLTDCCGDGIYEQGPCADAFEDISLTGTNLGLDDDDGRYVPLGFGFDYFGRQHFLVGVSSNGYCAFGLENLADSTPTPFMPSQSNPDGVAAPYWSDWNPESGGAVHVETRGLPGDRRCIVQWTDVPHFSAGGSNTFQVVFYEATNEIRFRYATLTSYVVAFPLTRGIENHYGSHGYSPTFPLASNTCGVFTPASAPLCAGAGPLVLDSNVRFSELDGSYHDLDGYANGVLKTNGLTVNSHLTVDVECATFEVQGDLRINGAIAHDSQPPLPHTGPKMVFKVCESVWLANGASIVSKGAWCGGTVEIFAGGDVHTELVSGIIARAEATYGSKGGWIDITADGRIHQGYQGYMVVKGEDAGHIKLSSCSGEERAIEIEGTLNAGGWGPYGRGGHVALKARQGGIWIVGIDPAYAAGELYDGEILMTAAMTVEPALGPFTTPDAAVYEYAPGFLPCECFELPEIFVIAEEE